MVEAYFLSSVLFFFLPYLQKPLFAGSATDLHLHKYIKVKIGPLGLLGKIGDLSLNCLFRSCDR